MSDRRIVELAVEVRNQSDEFSGTASPDDVVEHLLEQRLSELNGEAQKAAEKQSELRQKMGVGSDDGEEAELSEAQKRQNDVRERLNL